MAQPKRSLSIGGIRQFCDNVDGEFRPREVRDIPRGEAPKLISEAFLATTLAYLRACCDHIEANEPGYKDPLAEHLTKKDLNERT